MSTSSADYSSIGAIKSHWLTDIAPNYFNFDNVNNYQTGIFGYTNEVMGNSVEDAFNAMSTMRQEVYPPYAQNKQSLYKMATVQQISLPKTTPATAKAILIIPESEICDKSTYNNGIYTCVIDNSLNILADNIPFMLDYPIVIISKKVGSTWSHIAHYDTSSVNPLSTSSDKYVTTKIAVGNGTTYLFFAVTLRQLKLENISQLITKSTTIDIVTNEVTFDGNLADFEVYYKESSDSAEIELSKLLEGSSALQSAFYYYKMIDNNTIQITLPKNSYFVPALNSELRIAVYTSLGTDGMFDSFAGSLTCTANSETYPYNNTMTITGKINGKSTGGQNQGTDEEFRSKILSAYATNNTITSSSDLQIYFNGITSGNNKIVFRKKRDDALIRLFGAYCLLKDSSGDVIPTNTIDAIINQSECSEYYPETKKALIRPGFLFEYGANVGSDINYTGKKVTDLTIASDLSMYENNSRFLFTNPFLISLDLNNDIVGYYLNSINSRLPIEYYYVNDNTIMQFIGSSVQVERNAMLGENYYKFTITVSPSTDLDSTTVVDVTDPTIETNIKRATKNGTITSCKFIADAVYATVTYIDATTEKIQVGNFVSLNSGIFTYNTGYTMKFNVFDTFKVGDILAVKNDTDKGKLRLCGDLNGNLVGTSKYIPFFLQNYDSSLNTYEFSAYVSTSDIMSSNCTVLLENIYDATSCVASDNVSIAMNNVEMFIHVFFKNDDINYNNAFSGYKYFENYTLTNTYSQNSEDRFSFIQQIDFIRSTLSYLEPVLIDGVSINRLKIQEIPMVKANWTKPISNFTLLVDTMYTKYQELYDTYFLLENNFGIDFKLFNTFGKSRFYKVGLKDVSTILDSVNCSFNFGIYLVSLNSADVFITKFRSYVKTYIESINDLTSSGQSIYILNMLADIKTEFSEIGYIEYYGFNSYDHGAQKIEAMENTELSTDQKKNYIPEFINVYAKTENGALVPDINITILSE